jgi:WD40 repeat protein
VIFSVLPHLNEQGQMDLLDRYIVLLEECTVDRAISSAVGLITKIVNLLSSEQYANKFSSGIKHKLIQLIGTLGSYSISVSELKGMYFVSLHVLCLIKCTLALLRLLRTNTEDALDQDLSPFLLDVLRKMTSNSCPSSFFNFDGSECGLQMDEFYFPSAGYTFCSWVRIERTSQHYNYRFFSLFDTRGNGLELLFKGNHAIVQVSSGRKITRVTIDSVFHTNRWYFISFLQNKKFLGSSELQFFVDGELKQKTELKYPPLPNVIPFNHFGTNVPYHNTASQVFSFCGQCGPIAFFDKTLTSSEVHAIYSCGPDFQYNFKRAEAHPKHVEFSELALGTRLCLLFNPRACTRDRYVVDNSVGISSKKTPQTNARMLQGTSVFVAHNVRDTMNCIGGVQVIFPILKLLKEQWTIDYSMSARIISLLTEMLRYNRANQASMIQENGFCTLGYILSQLDPKHINTSALKALQGMLEVAPNARDAIVRDIFIDIFTNFELWIKVDFDTHEKMLLFLRDEVARNSDYFHEVLGVQYLLDILRYFFWYKPEKDAIATFNPPSKPSDMQLHTLRLHITEIIKLILANGVTRDEIQSILVYCLDCQDAQQITEMLRWLLVLIDEEIPGLIDFVSEDKFYVPFFTLLKHEQRNVRILALKVLGRMVEKAPNDRKYRFETTGGYLMMEHCFLDEEYFTNETFTALVEIILDRVSYKISASLTVDVANENVTISRPALLHPFFQLIGEQHVKFKERALRTFNVLLKSSATNRKIFAEQFGWQNWLLQLMVPHANPSPDEEKLMKTVATLTMDTIIVVLSEQLLVKRGWKMLRDTMQFIAIVSERKDMDVDLLNIDLFNQLLPIVVGYINKIEADKDKEFWKNLFHIVKIIEDTVLVKTLGSNLDMSNARNAEIFEKQIQLIKYLVLGFDYLIKMSLKEYKVMEILHSPNFSKGGRFGLQTIINLANDFTSGRGNIPERTFFSMIFRMQLFLLKYLDDKTIADEKHIIRLMALLCQDIEHTRVPKPIFKTEVTDADTNHRRSYYVLASLLTRVLNQQQFNIAPVTKALLRKKKAHFATTMLDVKAKEFLNGDLIGIDQETDAEEFILSLKDEWDCVKESEPLATILKEVTAEWETMLKKYNADNSKRMNKILQQIERRSSNDIPVLKKIVEESDQNKKYICYEELNRLNNWRHSQKRVNVITMNEWATEEEDLFSSGGVWHRTSVKTKIYQKLDPTENRNRMRMRLVVDPHGTDHPEASQKKSAIEVQDRDIISSTSEIASSIIKQPNEVQFEEEEEEEEEENVPVEEEGYTSPNDEVKEEDWESVSKTSEDTFDSIQKDSDDKIVLIMPCEMILPLDSVKGTLEVTSTHLYFIVTQDDSKDLKKSDKESQFNKKWSIPEIIEIYKRRYLLRYTAIEIFFLSKTNYFFNFETGEMGLSVINAIISQGASLRLHAYSHPSSILLKKTKLTARWQRREISNFEYLMALNTLANRTYNDLTQYPVFPWVIRDYESPKINLDNPSIYRNLNRPIGAQDDSRLKQLNDRYQCFVDPNIPSFHFGSHYSSVGTVLYYMIRLEPFTEMSIKLQGGSFDLADRLFHSIPSTWQNIMKASSDCKELTPEWFYCPEFLRNINKLNLGQKQNKEVLGDILLPPWASSPEEFIRINREALESDYVSENLHHWIDLIFGYKQTGEEAKKAYNVFYYLTYEGAVDLDKIQDPLLKKSIETQISNFGQTPSQLFKKPHPQRASRSKVTSPVYWRDNAFIPFYSLPVYELDTDRGKPLLYVENIGNNKIYVINGSRQLFIYNWMKPKATTAFSQKIGNALATDIYPSNKLYASSKDGKWIFSCGHFDKSIKCSAVFDKLQVKQSMNHHKDIVTCMAVSEDGLYLVSGSVDATVNVYNIVHIEHMRTTQRIRTASAKVGSVINNRVSRRLDLDKILVPTSNTGALAVSHESGAPPSLTTSNTHPLSSQPLQVLYGHEVMITCVDVNGDLDTVVSGDAAGLVILHTLLEGTYVRTIRFQQPIDLVKISSEGHVVVHTAKNCMLYVFNLNGTMLSKMDTNDRLRTCTITPDAKYVITGGMKKTITIRQLYDLRELHAFEPLSSDIQSVSLIKQDRSNHILATTTDNILHYLPVDQNILEREIVDLNPEQPGYIEVSSPTYGSNANHFTD